MVEEKVFRIIKESGNITKDINDLKASATEISAVVEELTANTEDGIHYPENERPGFAG
ncbi:MAG TPA: hypothetical protein VEF53_15375 [Patescibacteria group bacterium]|nr:hypothetical protein [Patescibacteria group bacterium]